MKTMILDKTKVIFEDELSSMTDEEYLKWFDESWVDIVRIGYGVKWIKTKENKI